jgi:hypothetical protein
MMKYPPNFRFSFEIGLPYVSFPKLTVVIHEREREIESTKSTKCAYRNVLVVGIYTEAQTKIVQAL